MSDTKPAAPIETRRLVAAHFVNSVSLSNERTSVAVGVTCLSIQPAAMQPDGDVVATDKGQRSDGLLVREKGLHNSPTRRVFVPWSNVRFLQYGE